nr:MAG TPA: hypothetical protein [Caudoviricetes sp.]
MLQYLPFFLSLFPRQAHFPPLSPVLDHSFSYIASPTLYITLTLVQKSIAAAKLCGLGD